MADQGLEDLLEFLKNSRGFDFTGYKRTSLGRRIERRMQTINVPSYEEYADYLEVHPDEFTFLFNTILINVTSFFRDPQIWSYIASDLIPAIVKGKNGNEPIRVWSAGCASGEEAYSAAMLLAEAIGRKDFASRVKIYGTDVDEEALLQARQASYTARDLEAVPAKMRDEYFVQQNSSWVFDKDLRRALIFGRHDLVQDAPISRIDLLFCRNTLMYFNAETQTRIMSHLHFAVRENGFVVLGKAEMLFTRFRHFTPVDLRKRVFTKGDGDPTQQALMMMAQGGNHEAAGQLADHIESRQAAFDAGSLPQLVVDKRGYLVLANARARAYFGLRADDIGRPFHEVEVSYRPTELRGPIEEVARNRRTKSSRR